MFLLYVLGVVTVALFNSQLNVQAQASVFECVSTGDPHLQLWRAKSVGQIVKRDCYTNGNHLLVKNQYVTFRVRIQNKLMTELTLNIHNEAGRRIFHLDLLQFRTVSSENDVDQMTKAVGVQMTVVSTGGLNTYNIHYPNIDFTTTIREAGSGSGKHYNIYIYQPPELVAQSTGICAQGDITCGIRALGTDVHEEAVVRSIPHDLAESICNQYINAFYAQTHRARDASLNELIASVLSDCIADLGLTGNIEMAQSAIDVLMMHELTRDATTSGAIYAAVEAGVQTAASTMNAAVRMANVELRRKRQLINH